MRVFTKVRQIQINQCCTLTRSWEKQINDEKEKQGAVFSGELNSGNHRVRACVSMFI